MTDTTLIVKAVVQDDYLFYSEKATEEEIKLLIDSGEKYIVDDNPDDTSIRIINDVITLYEWKKYKVKALNGKVFNSAFFNGIGEYGTDNFGFLKFKNRLGIAFFDCVRLDIVSKKITREQYDKMTEMVNKYVSSLSYDFNQSTRERIVRNRSKRTDVEYHVYLLIINALKTSNRAINIFSNFELIKLNPHRVMRTYNEYVNVNEVSELGDSTIAEILSGELELRTCTVSNKLSRKLARNGKEYIPKELIQENTYDSFDNNENRFIKFFFEYCLEIIEKFQGYFMTINDYSRMGLIEENKEYIGKIKNILNTSFLKYVGDMQIIPVQSTVLTKKEGYRQLFKLFTGLKSIPETASERDVFEMIENKSLDVIYENFCFFLLADTLCQIFNEKLDRKKFRVTKTIFSKTLQKTSYSNYFEYAQKGSLPRVRLHYNKNYSGGKRMESYSKDYDPDISLEIYNDSDEIEKIYMFDSKFKAVVFGEADDEDVVKLYKLDDISKMHAYKDAITNGVGAFVLYPGTVKKLYIEDDTMPYKGVGAMPLRPGIDVDLDSVHDAFLKILLQE